ncbi:PAX-interacting protein 1 [Phytophthora ramorum]|uniref:BRCT domain-containing protein n=1 Tax=Phytophthora ramorum TaxID=164328 RepID=H3GBB3_PHYRM|nr:PAX-interacting protein 1 [Phytophthora ramorum]
MAGEMACMFDGDSSGQETPVGFRDTPGQWYTANHRKRAALPQLEGEPTQRDSQATQVATEGTAPPGERRAPVFVAATPSQEENDGPHQSQHGEDELDEEETQIRMTNSEEQDGPKPIQRIFEEAVPLPIAGGAVGNGGNASMGNSDDDADSDMSDDMLEQDGSVAGLSSIAASFQQRDQIEEVVKKKLYKPRAPFRASLVFSTRGDSESSGGETEIEGEPNEVVCDKGDAMPEDRMPLRLTKSASYSTAGAKEEALPSKVTTMHRSLSTPETTLKTRLPLRNSKRDPSGPPGGGPAKSKRSRHSEAGVSSHNLDQEDLVEKKKMPKQGDKGLQQQASTKPRSGSDKIAGAAESLSDDNGQPSVEVAELGEASALRSTPRSTRKTSASSHSRKRTTSNRSVTDSESAGSQAEARSIRIVLTGLEPTAAIRKKIKEIPGAVYESSIEKATHVIAPQNQLKRTVKLLCGISCCTHILGERWLDESARVGAAVDEQANCLRDVEAEGKWQFDLRSTMYGVPVEQRQRLFAGFSVFITNHKSVLPPVKDLVKIVECAGGKATTKGKPGVNDLVITSEAALDAATVRKQLVNANLKRIFSPELILSSILLQRVELDKHRLEQPAIGKAWATKRRK